MLVNPLVHWKQLIRKAFHMSGLEVTRLSRTPNETLLGLRRLGIKTILDVGANNGQFARHIARLVPGAQLYCFEPLPRPFSRLSLWSQSHSPARAKVFNIGLGEENGRKKMFEHTEHDTSSSLLPSTLHNEELFPSIRQQMVTEVRVMRLDDFIHEARIELVPQILIKLDVQGYEARVIRGGEDTVRQAKACIVEINFDHLYDGQPTFAELWATFHCLGYRFAGNLEQIYAPDGHVVFVDALFVR